MTTVRSLKVNKVPRPDPLKDVPISFPPLQNLHLELLEVKDKLKPGLPLIPKGVPPKQPLTTVTQPKPIHQPTQPKPVHQPPAPQIATAPSPKTSAEPKDAVPEPKKKSEKKSKVADATAAAVAAAVAATTVGKKKKTVETFKQEEAKKIPAVEDEGEKEMLLELGDSDDEDDDDDDDEEGLLVSEDEDEDEESTPQGVEAVEGDAAPVAQEPEEFDIYAGLSPEEREIKEREEYIWRFRLLKKSYGKNASIPIPEYNEHSDLAMMKTSYERTIRELYLDDAIETYRTYLIGGWVVMEYLCTEWLQINLSGFTIQQIKMMHKYERMLIELGEKSYTRWGMNLPVEARLVGMILFQAAIFYLGKIISEKYGTNIADIFKGFTGQPPSAEPATVEEVVDTPPEKKMRGPSMKAADIRKKAGLNKEEPKKSPPEEKDE